MALGRIRGAHGLRGQVRVRWFTDSPEPLGALSRVRLGRDEAEHEVSTYEVAQVSEGRPGEVRVKLVGVDDRETAEALQGLLVMVEPEQLEALPEGEYYGYQLVGCRVEGDDGQTIGTVREIWSTGAPDLLVIQGDDGREHLVPAAAELLREVDVEGRRVVIQLIPGLLDC